MRRVSMNADRYLLNLAEVQTALGPEVYVEVPQEQLPSQMGTILQAAAEDSAFNRFAGWLTHKGESTPVAVSDMVLMLKSEERAHRTFEHVARAAHLRSELEGCKVAVETATGQTGLVSYWGFLHSARTIVILTLDTVNPQVLSVADLRALLKLAAERLTIGA